MTIIDEELVRRLVSTQFPRWADLPIRAIERCGWDNKTFHLGDDMSIRIPRAAAYAPQVEKEHRWLPVLAQRLPVAIPSPVAEGAPGEGLPWQWSIYRWLPGEAATFALIPDLRRFARDLAAFLSALHRIDASEGPLAGAHNFQRGAPPAVYDRETRRAIDILGDRIDRRLATRVWEHAVQSRWSAAPVWVHGDVSGGNILVDGGRLSAVIDFGALGVGDPACDLTMAWTFFTGDSRAEFHASLAPDEGTWARARGWALWKALIVVAGMSGADPVAKSSARSVLLEVLGDREPAAA